MGDALRQAWWAPIAALLVILQLALAARTLIGDEDLESRVVGFALLVLGAALIALGLLQRPRRRLAGNALVLIGCALAGFWLWTLVLPVLAIVVAVGVLTSGWDAEPAQP